MRARVLYIHIQMTQRGVLISDILYYVHVVEWIGRYERTYLS